MKLSIWMLITLTFCCMGSCKKSGNSGVTVSDQEKKLLGRWNLEKQIIEQAGQPTIENDSFWITCFMEFHEYASGLADDNSPIFSNTKLVEDNKDCNWQLNAWKI